VKTFGLFSLSSKLKICEGKKWVKKNLKWVEPKRKCVLLRVLSLPLKFHVNQSTFEHLKVGRSILTSIWTTNTNSNKL